MCWFAIAVVEVTALAQMPAPSQCQPIALIDATIHPVTSDPIPCGTVVLVDGKIAEIGPRVEIPEGCVTIDLRGKHVYPSLIQADSNLGLTEIGAVGETVDTSEMDEFNPNVRAEVAVNPESAHIPVARANGIGLAVTAPRGGILSGQAALIQLDGWTWKEMTLKAPLCLVVQWPGGTNQQQRLNQAIEDARAYHRARTSAEASPDRLLKTDVRWEAMIPVLERRLPVWIHANALLDIQAAVAWADRHRLKMVLVGGREALACADLLKRHDIPIVLTGVLRLPLRRDRAFDEAFVLPLRLREAGLRYCIASGGSAGVRDLPYHAAKAAAYGLPKDEALKAVTLYPAQIIGVADRVGSIEKGKDATLMVTDGDPLEITTQVEQLYVQGRRIDLSNKQQQLYEKYKVRYERQIPE